jgi:hypothetical protein
MDKGKMKKQKWVLFSTLFIVGMMPLLCFQQGCTANYPPISSFVATPAPPTPTPGPVTITFDGITVPPAGWIAAVNSGAIIVPALAVTAFYDQNQDSSCTSGCKSLWTGPIIFSAANQSVNIEYDYSSAGMDWSGKTISLYYYIDAKPSNQPYGQMYVQDTNYVYGSLGFAGGSFALTSGAWTQVSIPANQSGVNSSKILKFGAQIGTGSGGTSFNTMNYCIDYVTIQ